MAPAASHVAALVFLGLIRLAHGTSGLFEGHQTAVNVTAGQNLSLPCIVTDPKQHLIQFQWHKGEEQILVVFNPAFNRNISERFELVKRNGSKDLEDLQGSILHLYGVTEKDSGKYVCSMTLYPGGSVKHSTDVHVKAPDVQLEVTSHNKTLIEGDDVDVSCVSDPPADRYSLSCAQSDLTLMSLNGSFRIQNISRRCRNLTCRPQWSSSAPHSPSLRADVQLTVAYLDVECNSTTRIELEVGSDLIISCRAESSISRSLQFVWTKENKRLSDDPTMILRSVSPGQSGNYTLRVQTEDNTSLYRQKDFIITVIHTKHTDQSSITAVIPSASTNTEESEVTQQTSTSSTTSSIVSTVHTSSIAPSTGHTTTVQANNTQSSVTTSSHTSSDAASSSERQHATSSPAFTSTVFSILLPDTSTSSLTSTSINSFFTTSTRNISLTKDKKDQENTKSHAVYVIIPVLLLVVLIGFLYQRYLIQKKMDLPPPFKPPPPPVKYTSARTAEVHVTMIM